MFKIDNLLSFIVIAAAAGAILTPIIALLSNPTADAQMFMVGLCASAGFLIALALALGVIVNISQARTESE
jgi:hypothetical protein